MAKLATTAVKPYCVYIVRCADGTLYAGITTDVSRRVREHNSDSRGAKYTRPRRPVELVYQLQCPHRSAALKVEASIKQLSRAEKTDLIMSADLHPTERKLYANS